MDLVSNVFEIAESFMKTSKHVFINDQSVDMIAKRIKKNVKPKFQLPDIENVLQGVLTEIIAGSINYCYWYGNHTIRPNGASSTKMYDLLMESIPEERTEEVEYYEDYLDEWISNFKKALAINRFPLLEERVKHLDEINTTDTLRFSSGIMRGRFTLEEGLQFLVEHYPGYASDIFLKRASLLFIQFFRRFGWFNDELHKLHVPADYQVPKMLEHFNCFTYSPDLYRKIEDGQLIPKASQEECEIRSATIVVIKNLCERTGWNVAEIDAYFFLRRHEVQNPFHLTITTDY